MALGLQKFLPIGRAIEMIVIQKAINNAARRDVNDMFGPRQLRAIAET
jgi:hypothetical protein